MRLLAHERELLLPRRRALQAIAAGAASAVLPEPTRSQSAPDFHLEIAPYVLEASARHTIKTIAYNGQAPGPLLRFREGQTATVDVTNRTGNPEVVHWHGLSLPSAIDGAMEEGTPMIAPGQTTRYTFTPRPSGFRWYHTHAFAGNDLGKGQYTGQHGFLFVDPRENAGRYDAEFFLALHDWRGSLLASDDGSMNPAYDVATVNGRMLGSGEPLRVKAGQQVLLHLLNSSASETHWIALAGHRFQVIALDGNPVPQPRTVAMLRLAPAERVSAVVTMDRPGVWILGEVRTHIRTAGMGIAVEYAGRGGAAQWEQPEALTWDYSLFAAPAADAAPVPVAIPVPLVFQSKFAGHGALDHWTINGKSYPHSGVPALVAGRRYRLIFDNKSTENHPVHLHRHLFELCSLPGAGHVRGILKDTVLVEAGTQIAVEFTADNPGPTLFHCHQQNHMDMGFMMLLNYV